MDSLHEHLKALIELRVAAIEQRFAAMDRAVSIAYHEIERWQANSNEWRAAMDDRDRLLMPRTEIQSRFGGLDRRVEALEKAANQSLGRLVGLPLLISLAALALAAIVAFKG